MNICIESDHNYCSLLEIVMISIMENNRDTHEIVFHIFDCGLDENDRDSIVKLAEMNKRSAYIYNVQDNINKLKGSIKSTWAEKNSYATYARLFMADMLPDSVARFLYLDCDTLVIDSLAELFSMEFDNNIVAGVKDVLPYMYKKWIGNGDGMYFNAGVLLINSRQWRAEKITDRIIEYCRTHPNDLFADQDALNIVLKNRFVPLEPRYCVFFPEYSWNPELQLLGHGSDEKKYYCKRLLKEAVKNPVIIHYTDTILGRPWQENNINPYSEIWMSYYEKLPESQKFVFKKKKIGLKTKIYRVLYNIFPSYIFAHIYYNRRNNDVRDRINTVKY